jgi:hydroxyacylglutathione hydrolase
VGFADEHLIPVVDEALGNSAYLADLGDGRALAMLADGTQDWAAATGRPLREGR